MKIKRFTARDLPTATNMIKEEFGLAALILSQRELPADSGGGVEITAGVREEDMPARGQAEPKGPDLKARAPGRRPDRRPGRPPTPGPPAPDGGRNPAGRSGGGTLTISARP